MKIDRDASRFKQIVRGKIRENLRKYVTHGEMIGRKGGDLVSIPLPQLDVPHFRYGQNGLQWQCSPGDPPLPSRYLPMNCRSDGVKSTDLTR